MGSIVAFSFLIIIAIVIVGLIKGTGRNQTTRNGQKEDILYDGTINNNIMMNNSVFYGHNANDPSGESSNCDCDSGADCSCDSGCDCSSDCGGGCGAD